MLKQDEAEEEIEAEEGDVHMDSDPEGDDAPLEEILLQNDSSAHFDEHKDSIFCIAQHPVHPNIVVTGGGDDVAFIWDATPPPRPLLPQSYETDPQPVERVGQKQILKLDGHEDSVNAVLFTQPKGQYVLTAGLDGRLRSYQGTPDGTKWKFLAEVREVEEINWLAACPDGDTYKNTVALGASDGSVWVYTVNAADKSSPLTIVNVFNGHTGPCTAGSWSPDGKLLATVSEDGSLYVWDAFGEAAAAGVISPQQGGQSVVNYTGADERFKVEGGLYSVAVAPNGTFVAVGGAEGHIRIVGLPRLGEAPAASGAKGSAKNKAGGASGGQAGQILASLKPQTDSIESLSFASAPLTLLAAGSVDGSIALFDTAHRFAVRRHIKGAHDDEAVIKVEFVKGEGAGAWLLTSAGNDGVVRRWDARGGTAAAAQGLIGEWRGHRGGADEGGILGFVQTKERVVTAGDE